MPTTMLNFAGIVEKSQNDHFFHHIQQKTFLGSKWPSALKMGVKRENYTLIST